MADKGHLGRVEVVDSQTGAGGLGCLVIAAARGRARRRAERGGRCRASRPRAARDLVCLDTLEYLRRGGRIGAAQAMLGTALKVKPILTFGTEITPSAASNRRQALERMGAYLDELHDRGATDWIVQHAQSSEDAEHLVAHGTAIFGTAPLFCTQVGPVLGTHLGCGILVGASCALEGVPRRPTGETSPVMEVDRNSAVDDQREQVAPCAGCRLAREGEPGWRRSSGAGTNSAKTGSSYSAVTTLTGRPNASTRWEVAPQPARDARRKRGDDQFIESPRSSACCTATNGSVSPTIPSTVPPAASVSSGMASSSVIAASSVSGSQ